MHNHTSKLAHNLAASVMDGTDDMDGAFNDIFGSDDVDDALDDIFGSDLQKEFDSKLKNAFDRTDVPTTTLGDILDQLPPMILDQIMEIVNSSADDQAFTRQLKPLLNRFKDDLEAVGILPDYLAYALLYARKHLRGQM